MAKNAAKSVSLFMESSLCYNSCIVSFSESDIG